MQKQRSKLNQNNLKNAFCIGLFAIQNDCVARSYRFSVPLTNPDNNLFVCLLRGISTDKMSTKEVQHERDEKDERKEES